MRAALVYAVDNFLKGVQFVNSDVIAKVGHYIGLGLNHNFRRNISYLQLYSCRIFRTCIEYTEEDQSGVRSMLIREKSRF